MPTSNPLDILLSHDKWATQKILEACASLSEEQFHRRFEIGRGSLYDTLAHMIGVMRRWGDMLEGREQRPRLEDTRRGLTELLGLHENVASEFAASARKYPLEEIATGVRDGKTYTFARGAVITHVATHGMHHRAQCLNMLRQLGVTPLPPSSVVEWALTADGPR
jgi:uncharacterized damage-inducible protein DinB